MSIMNKLAKHWWSFKYGWLIAGAEKEKELVTTFEVKLPRKGGKIVRLKVFKHNKFVDFVSGNTVGAYLVFFKTGEPCILVNDKLLQWSEKHRQALYLHEVAHLLHKDYLAINKMGILDDPTREMDADRFVYEMGLGNQLSEVLEHMALTLKPPSWEPPVMRMHLLLRRVKYLRLITCNCLR